MVAQVQAQAQESNVASVDAALRDLLRYAEVFGAVAISREGLVIGVAGVEWERAEMVGALGASLLGAAERTSMGMGAGLVEHLTLTTREGMIHVQRGREVAVLIFTSQVDSVVAADLTLSALRLISEVVETG